MCALLHACMHPAGMERCCTKLSAVEALEWPVPIVISAAAEAQEKPSAAKLDVRWWLQWLPVVSAVCCRQDVQLTDQKSLKVPDCWWVGVEEPLGALACFTRRAPLAEQGSGVWVGTRHTPVVVIVVDTS